MDSVLKGLKNQQPLSADFQTLENQVALAKTDDHIRNELLAQYKPFIIKVTSKVCKQYIDTSKDEYSIALEAFNEAISDYQVDQGTHFLSFAEMVIRRRVIDYIRKEARQTRDIFLEPETTDDEEQPESFAQISASLDQYIQKKESERRQEDIEAYRQQLCEFDITFADLAECCPKHVDARENAKQIARIIAENKQFVEYLMKKKQLPMKELIKFVECSRKTIERNRKYIIAIVLIYVGGYQSLRSYIEPEQE